jgi:hypothetical protein
MTMPSQAPAGEWSSWLIGLRRDETVSVRKALEKMVQWGKSRMDGVDRVTSGRVDAGGWQDQGPSLHGSYRLACSVCKMDVKIIA